MHHTNGKKILILALFFVFCTTWAHAAEITVSAAASLTNAFQQIKELFEKKHPGVTVHTNFAASNPLLKQMEEGAPVDVFASADQETMDKACAAKVVDSATRKNFAQNTLVLIVPKGSKKPSQISDLESFSKIALGNPDSVPAGRYTKASLQSVNVFEKLKDRYIFGNSVRQVLDYVARGEVDCGFVYRTDALHMSNKVDIAMTVEGHKPVLYPIALATTGKNPSTAKEFINLVLSQEGMAILAKYGFTNIK